MSYSPKSARPYEVYTVRDICNRCSGTGKVHKQMGYFGNIVPCPSCRGTGKLFASQIETKEEPPLISIVDIVNLEKFYGYDMTLGKLKEKIMGNKTNECPQCNATGVTKAGGETYKCSLCDGEGYSEKRYKPRMVQDGWEEITDGKE